MRDHQNMLEVAEAGPDYLGFIFYAKSPRYVGDQFKLPSQLDAGIKRVGVFVNADTNEILRRRDETNLNVIQLHGSESSDVCATLRGEGLEVWKVFSVGDDFDFDICKAYADSCDAFLFDTKGLYYGGNAKTFNWALLEKYDGKLPFILSGGLTPDNLNGVDKFLEKGMIGVDLNSGVELTAGIKDPDKVRRVVNTLRLIKR